jgi:prophage regulatory protein
MNQIINIHQVVLFVGISRSTIYEMMDENSPYYDPTFPKKVTILQNVLLVSLGKINGLRLS